MHVYCRSYNFFLYTENGTMSNNCHASLLHNISSGYVTIADRSVFLYPVKNCLQQVAEHWLTTHLSANIQISSRNIVQHIGTEICYSKTIFLSKVAIWPWNFTISEPWPSWYNKQVGLLEAVFFTLEKPFLALFPINYIHPLFFSEGEVMIRPQSQTLSYKML